MNKFLKFDTFIAPKLIQIIFIINIALVFAAIFLASVAALFTKGALAAVGTFLGVALIGAVHALVARVLAEVAIVVFKIQENLSSLNPGQGVDGA